MYPSIIARHHLDMLNKEIYASDKLNKLDKIIFTMTCSSYYNELRLSLWAKINVARIAATCRRVIFFENVAICN